MRMTAFCSVLPLALRMDMAGAVSQRASCYGSLPKPDL